MPCGSLPKREPAMSIQLPDPRDGRRVSSLLEKKKNARAGSDQSLVLNPADVVIIREFDLIGGRDF
jgi:hypothetical protein